MILNEDLRRWQEQREELAAKREQDREEREAQRERERELDSRRWQRTQMWWNVILSALLAFLAALGAYLIGIKS